VFGTEFVDENHGKKHVSIWSLSKSRQKRIRKCANVLLYVTNEKPNTRIMLGFIFKISTKILKTI